VYTEASTVLRAVAEEFFLSVDISITLRITVFGTYHFACTVVRKTLDWKRSKISMFEVETVPQSCIP
jgi:hypothetical protein